MEAAEGRQTGGKQTIKGGTTNKEVLLDALRLDMANISSTASAIAEKEGNPGYVAKFRLPDSPGEAALLNAARLFKQNATPDEDKFIAYAAAGGFSRSPGRRRGGHRGVQPATGHRP